MDATRAALIRTLAIYTARRQQEQAICDLAADIIARSDAVMAELAATIRLIMDAAEVAGREYQPPRNLTGSRFLTPLDSPPDSC